MSKSMTKSETANALAEAAGITKKQVAQLMHELAMLAYQQAKNGFTVPGLGKLVLAESPPRDMVMRFGPDKGQTRALPAKTRVKFRLSKAAKDAILAGK